MIQIDLSTLVNRLHPIAKHTLENAAAFCVSHQQLEITVEQFLQQLLETPLTDIRTIFNKVDINPTELTALLNINATQHPSVAPSYPNFSPLLVEWLKDSWLLASAELSHNTLRSGALLLTLLQMPHRYLPKSAVELLSQINRATQT